jgi:hypothetical protein
MGTESRRERAVQISEDGAKLKRSTRTRTRTMIGAEKPQTLLSPATPRAKTGDPMLLCCR